MIILIESTLIYFWPNMAVTYGDFCQPFGISLLAIPRQGKPYRSVTVFSNPCFSPCWYRENTFSTPFIGPHLVLERCAKHVLIERNWRHERVSIDCLKPASINSLTDRSEDSFPCCYDNTSTAGGNDLPVLDNDIHHDSDHTILI